MTICAFVLQFGRPSTNRGPKSEGRLSLLYEPIGSSTILFLEIGTINTRVLLLNTENQVQYCKISNITLRVITCEPRKTLTIMTHHCNGESCAITMVGHNS